MEGRLILADFLSGPLRIPLQTLGRVTACPATSNAFPATIISATERLVVYSQVKYRNIARKEAPQMPGRPSHSTAQEHGEDRWISMERTTFPGKRRPSLGCLTGSWDLAAAPFRPWVRVLPRFRGCRNSNSDFSRKRVASLDQGFGRRRSTRDSERDTPHPLA